MAPTLLLPIEVLLASLIAGFVTASIKSWVDRFSLVILLTGLVGLPIQRSIAINLAVALGGVRRPRRPQSPRDPPPGGPRWPLPRLTCPAFPKVPGTSSGNVI